MHQNFSKEDLITFLENRASGKQANEIYHYLLKHPEALDSLLPEEEWQSFKAQNEQSEEWASDLWNGIQLRKVPSHEKLLKRLSVAAAILIIATGAIFFTHFTRSGKNTTTPVITANVQLPQKADTVLVNVTSKVLTITLDDSSRVKLFPSSVLQYHRGFEQNKRDVHLIGKAVFTVAHNKQKPFTVFTKNFSTTALGTIFMIEANRDSKTSRIQLLQGKVVVRNLAHPEQVEYLLASQECSFDENQSTLRKIITAPRTQSPFPVKEEVLVDDGTYEETTSDIIFKNLPLPKVLRDLSNFYHKSICFSEEDLKHRKFSGTIDKHQSLEAALNNLSYLNDLEIKKEDNCFRVLLRTIINNH